MLITSKGPVENQNLLEESTSYNEELYGIFFIQR